MELPSGQRGGLFGVVAPSVTEEGPQDVDSSACEGHDGLAVSFALGALAVVEASELVPSGC